MTTPFGKAALGVSRELHGVVVSAGLMNKTAKVRVGGQKWNDIVKKTFAMPRHYLVHDSNSSLRTGDVVSISPGWRTSQKKRHYVKQIIAPYGTPLEERPPIQSIEKLVQNYEIKRAAKDERRAARKIEEREQKKAEKIQKAEKRLAKEQKKQPRQEQPQTTAEEVN